MSQSDASTPQEVETPAPPARARRLIWRILRGVITFPIFFLLILWGTLAIYYSNAPASLRPVLAGLFAVAAVVILVAIKPRWKRLASFATLWGAVAIWWALIPPSNNRDWQADLAVLPWAEVSGDRVTVHNIRLCDYRTQNDFDVHHYDRTFDL